jgi:hypothetical protein
VGKIPRCHRQLIEIGEQAEMSIVGEQRLGHGAPNLIWLMRCARDVNKRSSRSSSEML